MRGFCGLIGLLLSATAALTAAGNLQLYFIDVEGGAATLIVAPSGESLLADTGNATADDRDAKRIYQAAQLAGLKKLDYVLITHFDSDHVGGSAALAKMIPIDKFLDHGDMIGTQQPQAAQRWQSYLSVATGKRTSLKPGEKIPLKGVSILTLSANGKVLDKPLKGGGQNPLCANAEHKTPDTTENGLSLGFLLTYGKFKFLDLGDLTWDREMELACPVNKIGTVTLYQPTWHGFANDRSGPPALVWAVQPQVAIVNNGPRKGIATAELYDRLAKSPGIEGIWQAHLALTNDKEHNTAEDMVANMEPTDQCQGHFVKMVIEPNGRFTVTNSRNNFSKTYTAR
jgi:beta-lactamase superfamily II metal-dependent hydrolase